MRILEGTPRELYEYETLRRALAVAGTPAEGGDDACDVFIRERFSGGAQEFTLAYVTHTDELGVRPVIRRSGQTADGRSKYLAIEGAGIGWSGALVYIHSTRVEFRLRHADVIGFDDPRVVRRVVGNPDRQEFQVVLRRQRVEDVDLALHLTRLALAKVLGETQGSD